MDTSIGSIIGTLILIVFGGLIAYFVPRQIRREGKDQGTGDIPIDKWIRILGIIVMAVGAIQVVLMIVL